MKARCRRSVLALLLLSPAAPPIAAQTGAQCAPQPIGGPIDVDAARPGTEESPDVAVLPDGSAIVVYSALTSPGSDSDRNGILMRRLGPDGTPSSPAVQLNTWIDEDQFVPRVAAAPDGRFAVVWQSDTSPGDSEFSSIRARVFAANGAPVGDDFQVNAATGGDQNHPDIDMANNGDFAVTWYDDADRPGSSEIGRGREVRVRLFSANGSPRSAEIQANTRTSGTQLTPVVGMAPNGSFVVAWEDQSDSTIRARRFAANGQPLDAQEFRVNQLDDNTLADPDLAVDADGSFLVAWHGRASAGSDNDLSSVQARGFLANGTAASLQQQLNTTVADDQFVPRVAAVGGREFLVAWDSQALNANPDLYQPIAVRALTLEGQLLGGEAIALSDARMPAAGGNRAGRSFVVGLVTEIRARGYDHPCATGGSGPTACVQGPTTLCLAQDRFRVTAGWETSRGNAGAGQAVELTPDTGYFWFFNQENVEMVIKVLNACSFANRFWVFAGGLTDVRVELLVEDTQTGATRPYLNPQGAPFQPIQDTNAFATCP